MRVSNDGKAMGGDEVQVCHNQETHPAHVSLQRHAHIHRQRERERKERGRACLARTMTTGGVRACYCRLRLY